MKSLEELKNSEILAERIEYCSLLKQELVLAKESIRTCTDEYVKDLEKKKVKYLQDIIAGYDIYRQKVVVKCRTCNEVECVCYVLKPEVQTEITTQELDKLF